MGKRLTRLLGATIAVLVCGLLGLQLWARSATRPANLGVTNGKLAPCPATPNCVSSQADAGDREHYIAPLAFQGNAEEAKSRLLAVLREQPRATLIEDSGDYVALEFRSPTIGYVDDVEFVFNAAEQKIDVRSAARLGRGDLGVNRNRVETIRAAFEGR